MSLLEFDAKRSCQKLHGVWELVNGFWLGLSIIQKEADRSAWVVTRCDSKTCATDVQHFISISSTFSQFDISNLFCFGLRNVWSKVEYQPWWAVSGLPTCSTLIALFVENQNCQSVEKWFFFGKIDGQVRQQSDKFYGNELKMWQCKLLAGNS